MKVLKQDELVYVIYETYDDWYKHRNENLGDATHCVYKFLTHPEDVTNFFSLPEVIATYPEEVLDLLTDPNEWETCNDDRTLEKILWGAIDGYNVIWYQNIDDCFCLVESLG